MRHLLALFALLLALPAHAVIVDWVPVGDAGNAADTEVMTCCGTSIGTSGYGSVADAYLISEYEVTNAQYAEFLNAVAETDTYDLYDTSMASGEGGITRTGSSGSYAYGAIAGREAMPVNYVSFWDAIRFANWLHNGQPTGAQDGTTTEDGAYTITSGGITNNTITRNAGATIFVTSEDEWYKAAYFNGSGYFDYPASSDTQISCSTPTSSPNSANCSNATGGNLVDVGSYTGSATPYGTFDQGGNVWEWSEAIIGSDRALRGGGIGSAAFLLRSWHRESDSPSSESDDVGFRVARIPFSADECNDGVDNDGDGTVDSTGGILGEPADPGCADSSDSSERDPSLVCDDGADNDGDGRIDFDPVTYASPGDQATPPAGSGDPGCVDPWWSTESPHCQDGIDNDGDGPVDYDGGLAALGYTVAAPDPYCAGTPWLILEGLPTCGLGVELVLLLPPLLWLRGRRRT
jgi:hypothetical protein